jgi:hypothetical protein
MDVEQYPEYLDNFVRRIFMIEDITHEKRTRASLSVIAVI